ncbi:MAG: DUF2238 domain-containing protein [Spirochaetes bacterium]|nr:DUF2238 domain-containing protein [Spirochaetota bacterium]
MKKLAVHLILFFAVIIWSVVNPHDYFTWFLEAAPAILFFLILSLTYKKFKFSWFVYSLVLLHCFVLLVGAKYTYAEVPLFDYFKEVFGFERNNYDKVGHFMQGFVPAFIARELLIRLKVVNGKNWLRYIVVSICLAISAVYEFVEWGVSLATGEAADSFLGTQGYVWDTQSDMLYATIGAIIAVTLFSRLHDISISKMKN